MKKFFSDFKDFIKRGNILDLAIGMIIGAAFNAIVKSLVNDIIMPLIGSVGGVNVSELKLILVDAVLDAEGEIVTAAVTLNYGSFIQSIIDFLIIAFSIFLAIRIMMSTSNNLKKMKKNKNEEVIVTEEVKEETKVVEVKPSVEDLLSDIKTILENKQKEE